MIVNANEILAASQKTSHSDLIILSNSCHARRLQRCRRYSSSCIGTLCKCGDYWFLMQEYSEQFHFNFSSFSLLLQCRLAESVKWIITFWKILFNDEGQTKCVQMTLSTMCTQTSWEHAARAHTRTHARTVLVGRWIAGLFMRLEHPRLWTPLCLESKARAQITFSAQLKQGCGCKCIRGSLSAGGRWESAGLSPLPSVIATWWRWFLCN